MEILFMIKKILGRFIFVFGYSCVVLAGLWLAYAFIAWNFKPDLMIVYSSLRATLVWSAIVTLIIIPSITNDKC